VQCLLCGGLEESRQYQVKARVVQLPARHFRPLILTVIGDAVLDRNRNATCRSEASDLL
jgi:hypothetical protein